MPKTPAMTPQTPEEPRALREIAPAWHTAGVVLILSAMVVLSMHLQGAATLKHAPHRVRAYVMVIGIEWLTVGFIWFGVRLRSVSLRTLTGGMSPRARAVFRDLGLAVAFLIVANVILATLGHLAHAEPSQAVRNFLPRGGAESAVFLLVALTAGICEELIYRRYLHQQFAAWTRSAAAGIIVQSIAFGVSH